MLTPQVLPRAYPYASAFISVGRFIASYPALWILAFGWASAPSYWEYGFILVFAFAITGLGRAIAYPLNDTTALYALYKKVQKQKELLTFKVEDYFPGGLAVEVVREGRIMEPRYTILYMPRSDKGPPQFTTTLYEPDESFVSVSVHPRKANPSQLYILLHELGHIGYSNYVTGLSRQLGALQAPFALLPIFLFVSFTSWWAYLACYVIFAFTVQSVNGGKRIEAEIEADHAALFQLVSFSRRENSFSNTASDLLSNGDLFVAPDHRLFKPGIWLREQIFNRMLDDARGGGLQRIDHYVWLASTSWEYKVTIIDLVALTVLVSFMDVEVVGFQWWSLVISVSILAGLYVFAAVLKLGNLQGIQTLIREKSSGSNLASEKISCSILGSEQGLQSNEVRSEFEEQYNATQVNALMPGQESRQGSDYSFSDLASEDRLLALFRKLANAEPTNIERQRDLAAMLTNKGDDLVKKYEIVKAMQYHHESLQIRQEIANAQPADLDIQCELSTGYDRMGTALMMLGDREAALANSRRALTINRNLVAVDPINEMWLRNLAAMHTKVGIAAAMTNRVEEGRANLEAAITIWQKLEEAEKSAELTGLLEKLPRQSVKSRATRLWHRIAQRG
jgi:tetratricopeptide (TPR) repeat protein